MQVSWFLFLHLFFFFQAEDGIRDIGVTGVQTCALPICPDLPPQRLLGARCQSPRPSCLRKSSPPSCNRIVPRADRRSAETRPGCDGRTPATAGAHRGLPAPAAGATDEPGPAATDRGGLPH